MVPKPYQRGEPDRRRTGPATATFECPSCTGTLQLTGGSWTCRDCGYVPRHGAD